MHIPGSSSGGVNFDVPNMSGQRADLQMQLPVVPENDTFLHYKRVAQAYRHRPLA
jgi:hypothetical protein